MTAPYYPQKVITPNLGLALYSVDEIIADNFIILDAFAGTAQSIQVNGTVIPQTNFIDSATVTFTVVGSNVTANAAAGFSDINGVPVANPNFNDLLPAAPLGGTNVLWQHVGSSISAYVVIPPAGVFPVTKAAIASNWLNSYNSVTGLFTATQPTFTDLSAHPTTLAGYGITDAISSGVMTTLGDIIYENNVPTPARLAGNTTSTREFLRSLGAAGVATAPVRDTLLAGDIPNLAASIITSGVLALARGGNTFALLGDLIYGGAAAAPTVLSGNITTTKMYLSQTGTSAVSAAPAWAQIAYADISGTPALAFLPLAGGTLTGGLGFTDNTLDIGNVATLRPRTIYAGTSVLAPLFNAGTGFQIGGAAASGHFLVGNGTNYVDATALPTGTVLWNQIGNAAGNLTLSNAGFTTEFDQTSAVAWLWANTTVATALTTNASPLLELAANYWTGAASAADTWKIRSSLAAGTNGKSTLAIAHSGSTGAALVTMPTYGLGTSTAFWYHGLNLPSDIYSSGAGTSDHFGLKSNSATFYGASNAVIAWASSSTNLDQGGIIDAGISRIGPASLAIGNGTAGNTPGNLSFNRVSLSGADFAGQATITAAATTKAVTFAANYTGTGQPIVVITPTSDPLALGVPVGYWVTYSGGAGAWTGFTVNIQSALAGDVTFNYIVIGNR